MSTLLNDADAAELEAKLERNQQLLPFFADEHPPLPLAQWPALDGAAQRDRAVGCLLGLAIGDALGAAAESLPRGSFAELTGLAGGGPLQLAPGEWTDATAMALCLAESLIATDTVDQDDLMTRLQAWMSQGENTVKGQCIAIGATTRAAIESFMRDDEPSAGAVEGTTAGNGSLIRLAPLAIYGARDVDIARFLSSKQSRTTHGTIECLDVCELFVAQLVDALNGADKTQATRPRVMQLTAQTLAINGGEWKPKTREQIASGAYVVQTLDAALWAVWNTHNFAGAVLLAANLGGDASGTAAVAGQLAGALYGASSIPTEWLGKLAWKDKIEALADDLLAMASA